MTGLSAPLISFYVPRPPCFSHPSSFQGEHLHLSTEDGFCSLGNGPVIIENYRTRIAMMLLGMLFGPIEGIHWNTVSRTDYGVRTRQYGNLRSPPLRSSRLHHPRQTIHLQRTTKRRPRKQNLHDGNQLYQKYQID